MEKIKILQFPIANSQGGITQYVLQNWKFIDKDRFHFDFATMSKKIDFAKELEKDGCKIFYISKYAEEDEAQFNKEFRQILVDGKYDVIHIHTKQWKSFNVEKIAKEVGIRKIIIHAHNTGIDIVDKEKREREEGLHNRLKDMLTEDVATDYWACSKEASEFLFGTKISCKKIKIMNNAIDINKYRFDEVIRKEYRNSFGVNEKIVLGNVGRLVFQKNQDLLIDIFAELYKYNNNIVLFIVGDGELKERLQNKCNNLGLSNCVYFLGNRQDTNRLYQMFDLFIFPSRFEGLGISLIEAQTAGLKCICSDAVPDEALITSNIKALPLIKEKWVCEIKKMINWYERRDMSDLIKKAHFDISRQIKVIENEYEKCEERED